jgi:hypothetical protein
MLNKFPSCISYLFCAYEVFILFFFKWSNDSDTVRTKKNKRVKFELIQHHDEFLSQGLSFANTF